MGAGSKTPIRLGFLLSGGGTMLQSIMQECSNGELTGVAEVAIVLSDNSESFGLERARNAPIPAWDFNPEAHSPLGFNVMLRNYLLQERVDLIIVTGYNQKIVQPLLHRIPALANHLALAPRLNMASAIKRALKSGKRETAVGIHVIDEDMGTGPIILQDKISIVEGESVESLQEKIRAVESCLYIEAIKLFAEDKLSAIATNVQILD